MRFIRILYLPAFLLLRSSCMPASEDLRELTAGRHVCNGPHDLRQAYCAVWENEGSVVALLGMHY